MRVPRHTTPFQGVPPTRSSSFRLHPSKARRGFTLVELLVAMAIIAILASVALGVVLSAQQAAREHRTRSLVTKLHNQMTIRWESYRTRRMPLSLNAPPFAGQPGRLWHLYLVAARRELMRMELPSQYKDLLFVPDFYKDERDKPLRPVLWTSYRQRIDSARTSDPRFTSLTIDQYVALITDDNQSAECLYMIMTSAMEADNTGRALFGENDVADTDNDGMLEFIDGWGNPIEWIRWPAGFISDLQPAITLTDGTLTRFPSNLDPSLDPNHDPFDPRQVDEVGQWNKILAGSLDTSPSASQTSPLRELPVDERGYRLFPLIFSAGPDQIYGLYDPVTTPTTADIDPYAFYSVAGGIRVQRGEPRANDFGGHLDNVDNHSLKTR